MAADHSRALSQSVIINIDAEHKSCH